MRRLWQTTPVVESTKAMPVSWPSRLWRETHSGIKALRTTAGSVTPREERITETAIHPALAGLRSVSESVAAHAPKSALTSWGWRIVDGSSRQGPGA
jgi:hypothetical protein